MAVIKNKKNTDNSKNILLKIKYISFSDFLKQIILAVTPAEKTNILLYKVYKVYTIYISMVYSIVSVFNIQKDKRYSFELI